VKDLLWPVARLDEALCRLGRRDGAASTFGPIARTIRTPRDIQTWLYAAAARAGLEAEPLHVQGAALEQALRTAGPMLAVISLGALALKEVRGNRAVLLRPAGGEAEVPLAAVCDAVRSLWEQKYGLSSLDALVDHACVAAPRRAAVRSSLQQVQLASRRIEVGWVVRPAPGAPWREQLRHAGQVRNLIKLVVAFAALQAALIAAWYLLGRGALTGNFDEGWLVGWAIALASAAVLQVFVSFWEGALAIAIGALLKKRMLLGALRLDPGALRHEGLGRAMGRVLEAEALEELSLAGGFVAVLGLFEFFVALLLLLRADPTLFAVLAIGLLLVLWACVAYYRRTASWTDERLHLTHELVERLVGQRTRVTQGDPAQLHDEEDVGLERYARTSLSMDRLAGAAEVLIPRGVLIGGLCGLAPLFLAGEDRAGLWIAVGGILLGQRALARLANGVSSLFEAAVAWKRASPLLRAARVPEEPPTQLGLAASLETAKPGETLLEMRQVEFRFRPERAPVLRAATLAIRSGERLLVEGGSGSGKSTLAGVLAGLRRPQAGLVLLAGLDRPALGAAVWRKKVAAAPQQHENHILQGTLAFNLLLGREWPAAPEDLVDAEAVCQELGLGDLLDRMPSRLNQTVGSTGWRLSHGEQSRVFIARALLQRGQLVILDESLAALDPESLDSVMACVKRRASTLLLIAHP
jgi:ATP-binding cassette, subfamily B, bacterial